MFSDEIAQRRTVSDIQEIGIAMMAWLTDEIELDSPGPEYAQYVEISHEELESLLVPKYIRELPEQDGWGHPYEFYLNVSNIMAAQVMAIRSPGRDGQFSSGNYKQGWHFDPDDFDQDIVWADGHFTQWPQ